MVKEGYIYIITNLNNTVLYTGVTSDLGKRIKEHQTGRFLNSFTSRYNVSKLVYYEKFLSITDVLQGKNKLKLVQEKRRLN